MSETLTVERLTIGLPEGADRPFAVENVSLTINKGEILCVVGESGSGKSMTALAVIRPPHSVSVIGELRYCYRFFLMRLYRRVIPR